MIRRIAAGPVAIAAATIALAGCGSSGGGAKSPLDDALGYFPKDAPAVVAVETDPEGGQWKQVNALIDKFAVAGQIRDGAKQRVQGSYDFDRDIKPQLENEIVVGIPDAGTKPSGHPSTVLAWKTKDPGAARKLLARGEHVGKSHGADVYQEKGRGFAALDGSVLVAAPTRAVLDRALAQRDGGGRMTEDEFKRDMGRLNRDALIRATGDLQQAVAHAPKTARSTWLGSLRTFAAAAYARPDGLAIDVDVRTEPTTSGRLPLALGAAPAPVVMRDGEIAIGVREPARALGLAYELGEAQGHPGPGGVLHNLTGVDLKRDLIDQIGTEGALSLPLDGSFEARADLKHPAVVARVLRALAAKRPKALPVKVEPGGGPGFYKVTGKDGRATFVGVVGKRLALGSDAGRAREFAAARAKVVPGTHGAIAIAADGKSVADRVIAKSLSGPLALLGQAITEPIGDLTGWAEARPSGITGHLELKIH